MAVLVRRLKNRCTPDKEPICIGGKVPLILEDGRELEGQLNRIHLEEDAGKLIHALGKEESWVDFNRAGTALIEIVTEPCIRSSEEAVAFLAEIRKLVMYLEICDGTMEEGSLRCDANVSVNLKGAKEFGTKVEVKNMNSIRNVQRAIDFEVKRQIELLENGGIIAQETRSFDALKGFTISMRSKEAANDYRYFPEPDLQPLVILQEQIDAIAKEMPPLPRDLYLKYTQEFGLSDYDAMNITDSKGIALYYESLLNHTKNAKSAANWLMGEIKSYLNENGVSISEFPIAPERIANLIQLIDEGKVSSTIAGQRIFPQLIETQKTPHEIAEALNLFQDSGEDVLDAYVLKVIEGNPSEIERYKAGDKQLIGFFMGQLMKVSKGKADPKAANELMRKTLEAK